MHQRTLQTDLSGVSQSTVSRCLQQFTKALNKKSHLFIRFPSSQRELQETSNDFKSIAGIGNIVGAIDCTHVRLLGPPDEDAAQYINRKSYFSVNIQVICNARNIITNVVAKWPGSAHDENIFKSSKIFDHMKDNVRGYYLVGDNGYHLSRLIIVPHIQPQTGSPEQLFNHKISLTRNPIEQTFGYMKRRFSIIEKRLDRNPQEACQIFITCACLHNIAMERGDMYVEKGKVVNLHNDVILEADPQNIRDTMNMVGEHIRAELTRSLCKR